MKGKRLWIAIGLVVSVVLVALVIKSRRQESVTEGHTTVTATKGLDIRVFTVVLRMITPLIAQLV